MTTPAAAHPDFQSEQDFLRHAYACLGAMRDKRESLGDAGGDLKASAALEKLRRKALERMDDPESICFGRIDYEEGERLHIGPQAILDGAGDLAVINWAADKARPYYEASPEEPLDLRLRRRFRTQRERLLGISDEVFGTTTDVEPTIGDVLLQELGRERTAEMREIAATIQRDQYRIISRPLASTTIVQGGPGTGKTAVGLHRAALLLYRHRDELGAGRVLIVGPNPLFMQYIAYVLPSLGETAADQVAVNSLGSVDGRVADHDLVARVKGDERMIELLRRAVVDRVRAPVEDIEFRANGISFNVDATVVAELVSSFDATDMTYVAGRDRFRYSFERVVSEGYSAVSQKRPNRLLPPVNVRALPEFERAVDRIWPTITAPDLVRQLLSSEDRLERAAADVLTEVERRLLYRKPVERLDQVRWTSSDGPLVDEVQQLIEPNVQRAGHVVLDEAQDLTPMQLRMVGRRIRAGSATILGDLAQATGLWSYATWDPISRHLGLAETAEIEELTLAYRVPREIMDIALPVLQLTAPSIRPPDAFRDGGELPVFIELARADRSRQAVDRAEAAHAGGGTAAIIAPATLLENVRIELKRRDLTFGDAERGELTPSIELLDPISAKGLEFDHVVLLEPAAIIREASEGQGHRELYVALTRAMRTLACLHCEPLPWPLGQQDTTAKPQRQDVELLVRDGSEPVENGRVSAPAESPPAVSVEEALVIARLRGIGPAEALARALLARVSGASESEVAHAVLASESVEGPAVASLLTAARRLVNGEDGSSNV
jgi:DNA helicase IV